MDDYYDSTVGYFDEQIKLYKQRINECIKLIRQLENDIEELNRLKIKMESFNGIFKDSVQNMIKRIRNMQFGFPNVSIIIKGSWADELIDLITSKNIHTNDGMTEVMMDKLIRQLSKIRFDIEKMNDEIRQCNINIENISTQRKVYIARKMEEKRMLEYG